MISTANYRSQDSPIFFIGRTTFIDGEVRAGEVVFDGFAIARARFPEPGGLHGRVNFSIRPQGIHLHGQAPPRSDRTHAIPGTVVQRAYLGEHWDYAVRPDGSALSLRVTARPHEVFEVGGRVWLDIDPGQMAAIAD